MKKKVLSFLMAAVMAFSTFAVTSFAKTNIGNLTFAPLTEEQLEVLNNGGRISSSYTSEIPQKPFANKSPNLPENFFLAKEGLKTNVGNQGKFGTCWAFSALTSSETELMKRYSDINLSESHLSYFSYSSDNQKRAFRYIFDNYNPFNNGGFDFTAMNSLANWYGPVYESDFPYSNAEISEEHRYDSLFHLQNVISFPEYAYEDEAEQKAARRTLVEQVKNEMYKNKQAVDIAYFASGRKTCYNEETNAWYNYEGDHTDHAVTIVGWDDNFSKENFLNSEYIDNDGAWLIQNSWGEEWGSDGCFWLSYEDVTIDYVGIYKYESNKNYENIYSHDESIQYSPVGFEDSTEIHMANVFTSSRDEVLEAVSFYTTDVKTEYTVEIYKSLTDDNDPVSGELVQTLNGIKSLPGYYTENLAEGVSLTKGEKFSVVVYLKNPTQTLTAHVEAIYMDYRVQTSQNVSKAGESFVSMDGESWEDIHKKVIKGSDSGTYMRLGNFTIKAFTSRDMYVKFSLDDGEVSLAENLELSSLSAEEIYYTTDLSDPITNGKLYTGPIVLEDAMTVKAVAVRDGVFGQVYSREYSQAKTMLSDLTVSAGEEKFEIDLSTPWPESIVLDNNCTSVGVTATSMYNISINGENVQSGETAEVALKEYTKNTIEVKVSGDGLKDDTYTIAVYINPISYDFENETIIFDESKVIVKTKYYKAVKSGQSVTEWIDSASAMTFIVSINNETFITSLPGRVSLPEPQIDFVNETSIEKYGQRVYYKFSQEEDFCEENSVEKDYIPVFPGKTMYLYRKAENGLFASEIVEWVIPERPEFSTEIYPVKVKKTKVVFPYDMDLLYVSDKSNTFLTGVFINLTPGESYVFSIFKPATEDTFATETLTFEITTKTDSLYEKLKADIAAGETDDSFGAQIRAFFATVLYNVRIYLTGVFE